MARQKPHRLLEVTDLQVSFIKDDSIVHAVDCVSFHINEGETLGLVGESGCGKTMTALAILKLIPEPGRISSGSVLFDGQDIVECGADRLQQIRGNQISMIFQDPSTSLNPVYTIGQQVEEALLVHDKCNPDEASQSAVTMLKRVGLLSAESVFNDYPHQLSGGMKQRAMIAMALCTKPKLLIADEPTTSLDSTIRVQILRLLDNLADEFGMSILFISHDFAEVSRVADRIAVMYAGSIVEVGHRDEIMNNPRHPYTVGLLNSVPRLDRRVASLVSIPGQPPELGSVYKGCAFAPRCAYCMPVCATHKPELISIDSESHHSGCHLNDSTKCNDGWPL